eukprot:3372790-Prymnesium_polylepis.1
MRSAAARRRRRTKRMRACARRLQQVWNAVVLCAYLPNQARALERFQLTMDMFPSPPTTEPSSTPLPAHQAAPAPTPEPPVAPPS